MDFIFDHRNASVVCLVRNQLIGRLKLDIFAIARELGHQIRASLDNARPTGTETREKAARSKEVLASIGRGLREQYDAPQPPLSECLAELVRKIEQSTDE
jgi:hypothetical protein